MTDTSAATALSASTRSDVAADLGADIGCHFDHVAIAAPRLRDLIPLWVDAMQGEFIGGGDNVPVGYRTARVAYSGGFAVELMEPLAGSGFFDKFFAHNSAGGVHHITFNVDNHELAYERLIASGYEPFGRSYANPSWHEMFLHPKIAHGVLVQVVRHPPERSVSDVTLEQHLAGLSPRSTGVPSP
jgi:methylmalonyl-CoA/ethylmalonyl-CoA epimerase